MRPMSRLALVSALTVLVVLASAESGSARQLDFGGAADVAEHYDFRGLAFSPDGRHAYTLGDQSAVFAVDESGGELRLTFVAHIEMPDYPLSDRREIVVSPDGSMVYITRILHFGGIPSAIDAHYELLVYRRSVSSGMLTLLESHRLDERTFVLSPSGQEAYSVCQNRPARGFRVAAHGLDPLWAADAAALTGGELGGEIRNLQTSPDGELLYALFREGNSVGVLSVGSGGEIPELVQLLRLDEVLADLAVLEELVGTADGRLFVGKTSRYSSEGAGVVTFLADEDGRLTLGSVYRLSFPDTEDPLWVLPTPEDDHVIVMWDGVFPDVPVRLAVYARGGEAGGMSLVQMVRLEGLPRQLDEPRFSPSADALLLPSASGIWSLPWTGSELSGSPKEILPVTDTDLVSLDFVDSAATAAGSDRVFVSEFSGPIGVFRRTPSGGLELETALDRHGQYLAMSADGRHLYGTRFSTLYAYELDPVTGLPAEIQDILVEEGAALRRINLSEDGRWLVAAAEGSVYLLERDPATGLLTPRDHVDGGELGFEFYSAVSAVVSADSRHVYAVTIGNRVVVFDLDPSSGDLTPKQTVIDTLDDPSFQYLSALVLSVDGGHLMVGGSNRLLVYERDAVTGTLQLVQVLRERGVRSLHALPDGRRLIAQVRDGRTAVVSREGLVKLFWRDQTTGFLELVEVLDNREIGVRGLGYVGALDPVRSTLYVAGVPGQVAVVDVGGDGPCEPGPDRLCLADDRFEVRVQWRDFEGNTGTARVAPARSDASGVLWFFSDKNWEMQVKVLDACDLNGRYWLFAAAATTVETTMTVTDKLTGEERTYFNPLGRAAPAVTDTDAFAGCGAAASAGDREPATKSLLARSMIRSRTKTTADRAYVETDVKSVEACGASPAQTCLVTRSEGPQRFVVQVEWRDGAGNHGFGRAAPARSDESALFWFFGPENWEVMVKILDGCALNDSFWVLSAATTDVEHTLRITDLVTGEVREYFNPPGTAASAVADVEAFGSCP